MALFWVTIVKPVEVVVPLLDTGIQYQVLEALDVVQHALPEKSVHCHRQIRMYPCVDMIVELDDEQHTIQDESYMFLVDDRALDFH